MYNFHHHRLIQSSHLVLHINRTFAVLRLAPERRSKVPWIKAATNLPLSLSHTAGYTAHYIYKCTCKVRYSISNTAAKQQQNSSSKAAAKQQQKQQQNSCKTAAKQQLKQQQHSNCSLARSTRACRPGLIYMRPPFFLSPPPFSFPPLSLSLV